jgi:hypothetical protein
MFSSESESYSEPARARDARDARKRRSDAQLTRAQTAALAVQSAERVFAQRARVINKKKHHTLTERDVRVSARTPAESQLTRNLRTPAHVRVNDDQIVFAFQNSIQSRAVNDAVFQAERDALALAQFRTENTRRRLAGERRR